MNISLEQLIDAIEAATIDKDISVPSDDYYAPRDHMVRGTITYVCPYKLVEALKEIEADDDPTQT